MSIHWLCKHHSDLDTHELYAILQLRTAVFVVEQRCAYQEVDGQDLTGDTLHLMGWQDDKLVAYLRLLDPQSQGGDVVIGRVVTSPEARAETRSSAADERAGSGRALLARDTGVSVGAGTPATVLCPARFCRGGGAVPRGWHPAYRHAQGHGYPSTALICRRCRMIHCLSIAPQSWMR